MTTASAVKRSTKGRHEYDLDRLLIEKREAERRKKELEALAAAEAREQSNEEEKITTGKDKRKRKPIIELPPRPTVGFTSFVPISPNLG